MGRGGDGVEIRPGSIRLGFTVDGKFYRRTVMLNGAPLAPTPANVRYAHRLIAEIRDRIKVGAFSMAEYFPASGSGMPTTVANQLDTWLSAQRIEHSTKAGYTSAAKFWKANLGNKALRALKHSDVLRAIADRGDLSGKTINNYVSVLREALALAVQDRLISSSPAEGVERAKWQREPPDPFTRTEAEAIIADIGRNYPEPILNLVEWRFFCGVRTSEAAGLHWSTVDLPGGTMVVREALVRGMEKDNTKTNVARSVKLHGRALAALQRQKAHTYLAGGNVWLDPRYGTPWTEERAFRRSYWEPCIKRLGIRYRPPNNMRHTCATMMLMAGMRPAFCARQLGHSVEVFLRTYARWLDSAADADELAKLEITPESPQERAAR